MDLGKKQRGVVFFTTLVLSGIAVLICSGITMMLLRDTFTVKRVKYGMQAYYLAEAGAEEALKEFMDDFNWVPAGYPKPLGAGTYSVAVSTYPTDMSRKLITATGTVNGVSKNIGLQILYTGPEAFNYSALGGGKLTVAGGSVVSDTVPINVHSNQPGNGAVEVGSVWPWSGGRVEGDVSACGTVVVRSNGVVTGSVTNGAPTVDLPPFDDNFFQYYYNLADADGKAYSGNQTFTSDPCAGTTNHVVYVNGQVRLNGTWSMTGCVVATGKIIINKWASGRVTQHQYGDLPALMSKGSDVEIYDPTDIEGMVYANGYIFIDSIFGAYGPTVIYGALYGKNWVNIKNQTQLHYRRPNPPGLPAGTVAVEILSWSGG
jgi:cytoskeletal protein CcmA (bactofilin family)